MGLFTFFRELKQKRQERAIAKNLKLIQNPKTIREERVGAIEFFNNLTEASLAVPALLKRFDYSLDHSINDTREKESAMEGIFRFGAKALPQVKEHLKQSTKIAWPIKIFQKLGNDAQVVNALEDCLDLHDFDFDRDKIDKNYDILCYLRDYTLPDRGEKLLPLLKALDERVRYATVEVLLKQDLAEDYVQKLERFLTDLSPENSRIHQIVLDAFLQNNWTIHSSDIAAGQNLGQGILVTEKKQLRKA